MFIKIIPLLGAVNDVLAGTSVFRVKSSSIPFFCVPVPCEARRRLLNLDYIINRI